MGREDELSRWRAARLNGQKEQFGNRLFGFSELISRSMPDYLELGLAEPIILAFWPIIRSDDILPSFLLPGCQWASLKQTILTRASWTFGGKYRLQKYSCAVKNKYQRKQSKEIQHVCGTFDIWLGVQMLSFILKVSVTDFYTHTRYSTFCMADVCFS